MTAMAALFIISLASAIGCLALAVGKMAVQKPPWAHVTLTVLLFTIVLGFIAVFFSPTTYASHQSSSLPNVFQWTIAIAAVALSFCLRDSLLLRTVACLSFVAVGAFGLLSAGEMGSPNRIPYGYRVARLADLQRAAHYAEAFETPTDLVKPGTFLDEHPDPEVRALFADDEPIPIIRHRRLWHSWFTDLYETTKVPTRYRILAYDGKTYTLAAEPRQPEP